VISLCRLKDICRLFDDDNRAPEINAYITGKRTRKDLAGRGDKLDEEAQDYLKALNERNPSMKMTSLASKFRDQYYIDPSHAPCPKTVNNYLHKFNLSTKKPKREHRNLDPSSQLEFLDDISPIDPSHLVDIDGTMQRPKDFHSNSAWSTVGSPAIKQQIVTLFVFFFLPLDEGFDFLFLLTELSKFIVSLSLSSSRSTDLDFISLSFSTDLYGISVL
jgi:hypothetical protein